MLKACGIPYEQRLIKVGKNAAINTIYTGSGPPLVMLHGFGAGVGFWVRNLCELSKHHTVYAIDLLGFGRSSRSPYNGSGVDKAENYFVDSLENWRKEMNLNKFNMLGHSFGGYLSTLYAIKYPKHVHHLFLADPWGINRQPDMKTEGRGSYKWKLFLKLSSYFGPLSAIRWAGPYGPKLIEKYRSDIAHKFVDLYEDTTLVSSYIYHLNAQNPSGETAFRDISSAIAWSKHPLCDRMHELSSDVKLTFMYGSSTWMDIDVGYEMSKQLGADFHIIEHSGHHIYTDNFKQFNSVIISTTSKFPLAESEIFMRNSKDGEKEIKIENQVAIETSDLLQEKKRRLS